MADRRLNAGRWGTNPRDVSRQGSEPGCLGMRHRPEVEPGYVLAVRRIAGEERQVVEMAVAAIMAS